jgi:hypothetical protein
MSRHRQAVTWGPAATITLCVFAALCAGCIFGLTAGLFTLTDAGWPVLASTVALVAVAAVLVLRVGPAAMRYVRVAADRLRHLGRRR